jgi:hypothetical protein
MFHLFIGCFEGSGHNPLLLKNKVEYFMARRPRLDMAGFHHIINRGIYRGQVLEITFIPNT